MRPLPLHEIHAALGARFGELQGAEVVRAYGELAKEYEAARSAAGVVDLSYRELVRVTGPDRVEFVHGMVTNDVTGLPEGHTNWTALLTNKGAMEADARLWRRPEDLLIELEPGLGEKARGALERYLISEEAEVSIATDALALVGIFGPKAREVASAALGIDLAALPADQTATAGEVRALAIDLVSPGSLELLMPRGALGDVWARLMDAAGRVGARPAGFDALEVLRVEAGVPRYGADMDDRTLPLEANLSRAIHYKKGCYVGQEVIARATFRGHVNRKLSGLSLDAEAAPGTELLAADKKAGWITSAVQSPRSGWIALGYVHRDFLEPGTRLALAGGAGSAVVRALPQS